VQKKRIAGIVKGWLLVYAGSSFIRRVSVIRVSSILLPVLQFSFAVGSFLFLSSYSFGSGRILSLGG
jgi:hypothetical protein